MTKPKNTSQSHVLIAKERARAIIQLRLYGIHLGTLTKTERVVQCIGEAGVKRCEGETTLAYLRRFVDVPTERNFVPARTMGEFRPLAPRHHPRQAEIDAQPRYISMGGIGNFQNRISDVGL